MADKKISQLTAASTPLAGTEVLPIVQSNATVKVATNDLTVKNIRSNATTGILQIAGPATAATRVMTVPDANFTAARIDAAQSFTGNQTLSTGNLVIGTAGKGIDFSANTNAAGMTSELLTWYEEGSWTPSLVPGTSGSISLSTANGVYTRIGRTVSITAVIVCNGVSSPVGELRLSGLPFTVSAIGTVSFSIFAYGLAATATTSLVGVTSGTTTYAVLCKYAAGNVAELTGDVQNGTGMYIGFTYLT